MDLSVATNKFGWTFLQHAVIVLRWVAVKKKKGKAKMNELLIDDNVSFIGD